MNEKNEQPIVLPEGATVLVDREPLEPSVEFALELARIGVSDLAIEALGGEEAVMLVREERGDTESGSESNGATNGHRHATSNGH